MPNELLDDIDFEEPGISKEEMESYLSIFIGKRTPGEKAGNFFVEWTGATA